MPTWPSYSPRDFLMFGPEVYWRLFELQNRALWPLPVLAGEAGVACLLLVISGRGPALRGAVMLLAVACLGAAYFLAARYAPINWPAGHAAWGLAAQAGLLALVAVAGRPELAGSGRRFASLPGWGLLALATVLYPALGLAAGRPLAQAEIFGLAPDPTAIACLGLASLVAARRHAIALAVIPALWCGASAATLLTLGEAQGWVPLAALALWGSGVAAALLQRR